MHFFRTPFILPLIYPALTWSVPAIDNEIYLTFDDGPVPGPTEFVIETLEKYKALATFFCIGENIVRHGDIFSKIIKAGHAVGNHTHNHLKGWNYSVDDYKENVDKCEAAIKNAGYASAKKLFRPPYGRIRRSQASALSDYEIIMWSVLTYDYNKDLDALKCLKGTTSSVVPGAIIVMHDSLKAEKNMRYVLPRLLDHFSRLNYVFKPLFPVVL